MALNGTQCFFRKSAGQTEHEKAIRATKPPRGHEEKKTWRPHLTRSSPQTIFICKGKTTFLTFFKKIFGHVIKQARA